MPGTWADSGANICYYYRPQTEYGSARGYIFCVPGNNTNEFWVYDISQNTWTRLEDVPNYSTGVGNGAALETGNYVRIGNDLYVRIYLLKGKNGGGAKEFYTYNWYITALSCSTQSRGQQFFPPGFWKRLADLDPYYAGYGGGAEITYVPSDNSLFAFSGYPYSRYFFRYDIATDTWLLGGPYLPQTPDVVGAGASLVTWGIAGNEFKSTEGQSRPPWNADSAIYAFRGSWVWSNPPRWSNDFWYFKVGDTEWNHDPPGDPSDPPENVGYGADLNWGRYRYGYGADVAEYIYATFGETRRPSYTLGLFYPFEESGGGQSAEITLAKESRVTVTPNPFTNWCTFNLTRPSSQVLVRILDNTGKLVKTIQSSIVTDKIYWDGSTDNGEPVQSGVYFYFLTSDKEQAKGKIIKR